MVRHNNTPLLNTINISRWAQSDSKSLKFAIHFVQRLSAALAPNFKMAANFSVQEVLEMVARDEEMDVDVEEKANEEVTLIERIKEYLKEVGDAGIFRRHRRVNACPFV